MIAPARFWVATTERIPGSGTYSPTYDRNTYAYRAVVRDGTHKTARIVYVCEHAHPYRDAHTVSAREVHGPGGGAGTCARDFIRGAVS